VGWRGGKREERKREDERWARPHRPDRPFLVQQQDWVAYQEREAVTDGMEPATPSTRMDASSLSESFVLS
jgi:hypothetical protein